MMAYDVVQVMIIGCAVLASAGYALARVAPGLRARVGELLGRSRYRMLKAAGARLVVGGGSGCGGGCSSCGGCGSPDEKKLIPAKPVR